MGVLRMLGRGRSDYDSRLFHPTGRVAPPSEPLSPRRRALTVARFAGAALSLTQGILVARWLGPEQYGTAALVMTYPAVLFSFLDAKSGAAGVKYISEFEAKGEAKMALAMCKLGYGIDAALAAAALAVVAATAWWAEEHVVRTSGVAALMVVYAAALLPRALTGMSNGILSVLGRFQVMAWTDLNLHRCPSSGGPGTRGGRLGRVGSGVRQRAWARGPRHPVRGGRLRVRPKRLGGLMAVRIRSGPARPRERDSLVRLYVDLTELLGSFSKKLDVVLLGFFRGPEEVGLYRAREVVLWKRRAPGWAATVPSHTPGWPGPSAISERIKPSPRREGSS